MSYPIPLLMDPPKPTYPEYDDVVALARSLTPQFVNPANLRPEREVVDRRGNDWCTAVLGRPFGFHTGISIHEQYLLIAADQLGVDPPLPDWIVEAHRAGEEHQRRADEAREARRQRERDKWATALAGATVGLDVHYGSRPRAYRDGELGHAVPRDDVYSGARKVRTHPRGRALCETPTRAKPLAISETPAPAGTPATCVRCLEWTPNVRPNP